MVVGGPRITLSNGVLMPLVGLGTWQSSRNEVKKAVATAIDVGYRLIDTAASYGNEEAIGEAVCEAIDAGKIKREDLFITTKLAASHLSPKNAENACRESLKRLRLNYIDLYLAHFPTAFNTTMAEQDHSIKVEDIWSGMEHIYELKLARAIGVSNWSTEQIERVMASAKIPIHNNQIELYLYWPQHDLHSVCTKHKIAITSYATLGSPGRVNFLSRAGTEVKWAPAPNALEDLNVIKLSVLYRKSPAQILLRYVLDRGIAVIPKSVNVERIKENFNILDFHLTKEQIEIVESSEHRQRLFTQDFLIGHPEDPFKNERNISTASTQSTMISS